MPTAICEVRFTIESGDIGMVQRMSIAGIDARGKKSRGGSHPEKTGLRGRITSHGQWLREDRPGCDVVHAPH